MAKSFDELCDRVMSQEERDRADERAREIMATMLLSELRHSVGLSQKELAAALGVKQPTVAKIEKQSDMQVGTLRRLVEALGGRLRIIAEFPQGRIEVGQFSEQVETAGQVADEAPLRGGR